MIRIGDRQYRDFSEYADEYFETEASEGPAVEAQPESEDQIIQREQIEALNRVHEPTERAQNEAGTALAGNQGWRDWQRFRDL